ncbi:MFS transporter [Rhizohabitans arisaemae]|uniref:MFS transporter n=1 Tax=Rhizohabitans arisaemae TaxID=2720610 RepID=UPI0024B2459C|nr:MFS transporter [Rhizohabitans arisaemae]
MTDQTSVKRAGSREWIGLAVLVLPTMLLSIDVTVLTLAVPSLSEDLQPSGAQLLWINDIYGFLIAGFLITMGNLGDRYGRRRVLLIGAAAFAVASALAAFASSAELLIVARALLGVAGATLMPSTLSLISNMFHDPVQRTRAISLWMSGFTGGMVLGPFVGGLLLEHFWWGAVFLINLPVMAILLVAGPLFLPEYRTPGSGPVDLASVALSVSAALLVVYGVKEIAAAGAGWPAFLALAAGIGVGVLFVRRQRRLAEPLLDLKLFAVRRFSAALGTLTLVIVSGPAVGLLAGQYLQLVLGLSPFQTGLVALAPAVAVLLGFTLAPALAKRWGARRVSAAGLVVSAFGVVLVGSVGSGGDLALVLGGQVLFFLGGAPLLVLGIDMVVGAAPRERSGSAAALSETAQEFGGALGLAIFGSVATAVYRIGLTVPEGTPEQLAEAARDTLGGAVAVAGSLPGEAGTTLIEAAGTAFTDGLQVAMWATAAVLVAAAALAAVALPRGPAPEQQAHG